jgi:hypothetical protein
MQLFFSATQFFIAASEQLGSHFGPRVDRRRFAYFFLTRDAQSTFRRNAKERISTADASPFLHNVSHLLLGKRR